MKFIGSIISRNEEKVNWIFGRLIYFFRVPQIYRAKRDITRIGDYFNKTPPNLPFIREELVREKINHYFYTILLLISVSVAFFAGRTVKFMENRPAFYFESLEAEQKYQQQIADEEKEELFNNFSRDTGAAEKDKMIVASKGGKKYYYVWCKGAENIKEKNKRYFANEQLAEQAGYTKAASCK